MKSRLTLPLLVALTIGGYGVGIHGSVPDVPTGQWMPGASLAQPREGAVSVALRDGRVLIIGGRTAAGPVGTVESLNSDGSLTVLHSMSLPRGGHTAVRLADDRVLVVGGTTTISSDQGTTEAANGLGRNLFAGRGHVDCRSSAECRAHRTDHARSCWTGEC